MAAEVFLVLTTIVSCVYASVSLSFLKEPESLVVFHQASVTLSCMVAPSSAVIRWMHNDQYVDQSPQNRMRVTDEGLVVRKVRGHPWDEGTYHCVASTPTGSLISRPAKLTRAVIHKFPEKNDINLNFIAGSIAVLPCQPPKSVPVATVYYEYNGSPLKSDVRHKILPSGNLLINGVRLKDAGSYRCVAINTMSNHNRSANHVIHVQVAPTGASAPGLDQSSGLTLTATVGQEITLECLVSGFPIPKITWTKYGGQLPDDREVVAGNLIIRNIGVRDQGTYLCQAENGIGSPARKQILVDLRELPTAKIRKPNTVIASGNEVTLECDVYGTKSIQWYHNARPVIEDGNVVITDVLTIKSAHIDHSGLYQCMVKNQVGASYAVAHLDVIGKGGVPPGGGGGVGGPAADLRITQGPTNTTANINETITLLCRTDGATNILWLKEDNIINGSLHDRFDIAANGSLRIRSLMLDDGGKYSCVATRQDKHVKASAFLKIRLHKKDGSGKPKGPGSNPKGSRGKQKKPKKKHNGNKKKKKKVPPSSPQISKLSDTSVKVTWSLRDNDGMSVKFFRVQYKRVQPKKSRFKPSQNKGGEWKTGDTEILARLRKHEVSGLNAGATYRFRIAAVYMDNDNLIGPNSDRFTLEVQPPVAPMKPSEGPIIVEADPILHQSVHAIAIKWRYESEAMAPIEGFFLYFKPYNDDGAFKRVMLFGEGLRRYLLMKLESDTEYSIKMEAFNSAGSSHSSNIVVERTIGTGQDGPRTPVLPTFPIVTTTESKGRQKTGTESSSEMLYMILGGVLGLMMLLLIIFMVMCWWKQRQQRRMAGLNEDQRSKFQDSSQRIYSDNMRKKYSNGFMLNGINSGVSNGHGPRQGHQQMHINVNPMSEVDRHDMNSTPKRSIDGHSNTGGSNHTGSSDTNCNSIHHSNNPHGGGPSDLCMANHRVAYQGDLARPPPEYRDLKRNEHFYESPGQSYDSGQRSNAGSECTSSQNARQKKRRRKNLIKEQPMKDQATNTDLSSNEGTLDSSEIGTDGQVKEDPHRTVINNSTQCADFTQLHDSL